MHLGFKVAIYLHFLKLIFFFNNNNNNKKAGEIIFQSKAYVLCKRTYLPGRLLGPRGNEVCDGKIHKEAKKGPNIG